MGEVDFNLYVPDYLTGRGKILYGILARARQFKSVGLSVWGIRSSGTWRRVTGRYVPKVSRRRNGLTFKSQNVQGYLFPSLCATVPFLTAEH